jgi:hypothetical protein
VTNTVGPIPSGSTYATATGSTIARTINDRWADFKNIVDYGAVADGVAGETGNTNNTTAIQNAINAANVGDDPKRASIVLIPGGIYQFNSQITNPYNVPITGNGVLLFAGSGADAFVFGVAVDGTSRVGVAYQTTLQVKRSVAQWMDGTDAGYAGIKTVNAHSLHATFSAQNFDRGVVMQGYDGGSAYNIITLGRLNSCRVGLTIEATGPAGADRVIKTTSPDAWTTKSGWSNQNTYIGGRFSGSLSSSLHAHGVEFITDSFIPNGNLFLNPSFEIVNGGSGYTSCFHGTIKNTGISGYGNWATATAYDVGDRVMSVVAGFTRYAFECTVAGTSDGSTCPLNSEGTAIVDGSGALRWRFIFAVPVISATGNTSVGYRSEGMGYLLSGVGFQTNTFEATRGSPAATTDVDIMRADAGLYTTAAEEALILAGNRVEGYTHSPLNIHSVVKMASFGRENVVEFDSGGTTRVAAPARGLWWQYNGTGVFTDTADVATDGKFIDWEVGKLTPDSITNFQSGSGTIGMLFDCRNETQAYRRRIGVTISAKETGGRLHVVCFDANWRKIINTHSGGACISSFSFSSTYKLWAAGDDINEDKEEYGFTLSDDVAFAFVGVGAGTARFNIKRIDYYKYLKSSIQPYYNGENPKIDKPMMDIDSPRIVSTKTPSLATSVTASCTTTDASTTVTTAATSGLAPGLLVTGGGIVASPSAGPETTIASITNGTTLVLSQAAVFTTTSFPSSAVTHAAETVTITDHTFEDNAGPVQLTTSAADLPNGLALATNYWIDRIDADTIKFLDASGGSVVTFSDDGSGTHTISGMLTFSNAYSPGVEVVRTGATAGTTPGYVWDGSNFVEKPWLNESVTTFANADATPSVAGSKLCLTTGTTAITDFDDGVVGQTITVKAKSSITITDGGDLELVGNFAMTTGDTITLTMLETGKWSEISRSNIA